MILNQECLDFEKFARRIIGLTVLKVEYYEIMYDQIDPTPNYPTHFKNLDSVDYSIFLYTDQDNIIEIYWDEIFHQFGIGLKLNENSDFSGGITWGVSNNDLWKQFIGTTISDIQITWETVTRKEGKSLKTEGIVYPQNIKISFSNDKHIFVSAAGFLNQGEKEVHGMSDNLMVTDNEELARLVKIIYK